MLERRAAIRLPNALLAILLAAILAAPESETVIAANHRWPGTKETGRERQHEC